MYKCMNWLNRAYSFIFTNMQLPVWKRRAREASSRPIELTIIIHDLYLPYIGTLL